MSTSNDYVLGTHDAEMLRLGFQHQVWAAAAYQQWYRARFLPGQTLLDVGCGPGHTTRDLAGLAGASGHVIAVDESEKFVDLVRTEPRPPGTAPIEARVCDVQKLDLSPDSIDGAYSRWVLCFVPDPLAVVKGVARALKPGAAFAVQDYYRYTAIVLAPQSEAFRRVIRAVDESWRKRGGDPDVGCRIPALFEQSGLTVTEVRPIIRTARPNDLLWQWPTTFFRIFVPSLVGMGMLTKEDQAAFEREWAARSADPGAFFASPPMIEIIGVKR